MADKVVAFLQSNDLKRTFGATVDHPVRSSSMGLAKMAQHRQQAAGFKEEPSPDSVSFYFTFLSEPKLGTPYQAHEYGHTIVAHTKFGCESTCHFLFAPRDSR